MNLTRANEIVDQVEDILTHPNRYQVGKQFYPLSATKAASRKEIAYAMFLVVAQTYENVAGSIPPQFATFTKSAGSSLWNILFLMPALPDQELKIVASSDPKSGEFIKESLRLSKLAAADLENGELGKLETMESFVAHLKTLDALSSQFWPAVYARIGLQAPAPARRAPPPTPQPWWRFW